MSEDISREIASKCNEDSYLWRVGEDQVELALSPGGWIARVRRAAWSGDELVVDNCFENQAEAWAWCERMASALACDLEDIKDDQAFDA